jgi:hypothetical protein
MIEKLKNKELKTKYEFAENCFNFQTVQDDSFNKSKENISDAHAGNMILYADNREKLKKLFGPCAFTYRGEFYFHVYTLTMESKTFYVSTAKGYGTSYQVESGMNEMKKLLS